MKGNVWLARACILGLSGIIRLPLIFKVRYESLKLDNAAESLSIEKGDAFEKARSRVTAKRLLNIWSDKLRNRNARTNAAGIYYQENLAMRSIESWKTRLTKQRLLGQKALVARDFFLCRRVWVTWILKNLEAKGQRVAERRKRGVMKEIFDGTSNVHDYDGNSGGSFI